MKHKGLGMNTRKELIGAECQAYGKAGVSTTSRNVPLVMPPFVFCGLV
jgi:hypothetical protein